ncbi:hypothetical protein HK101_009019 [Irineochytrium annulatum]|nr:hypothetical protein HK101_009019 [Irineochytrium annulatum]
MDVVDLKSGKGTTEPRTKKKAKKKSKVVQVDAKGGGHLEEQKPEAGSDRVQGAAAGSKKVGRTARPKAVPKPRARRSMAAAVKGGSARASASNIIGDAVSGMEVGLSDPAVQQSTGAGTNSSHPLDGAILYLKSAANRPPLAFLDEEHVPWKTFMKGVKPDMPGRHLLGRINQLVSCHLGSKCIAACNKNSLICAPRSEVEMLKGMIVETFWKDDLGGWEPPEEKEVQGARVKRKGEEGEGSTAGRRNLKRRVG